ncbi:MAG: LysR family transcriptional regulator [Acholeplasmataceae bacterium]|nr:LysR family transcriptional regulator [Acidaminococcaceae bacterium]NLY83613.1 LysR family transcriptional regulator [Acholeplasmataceae bacterium]
MNLDYYKNFRVIVEAGSLAAAAKKLHIAQSALSSQLKAFEAKFGTELLITKRGVRKLKLTEAGRILYEKSSYICKLDELVLREIEALSSGTEGTLCISLSPSMSLEFIDEYLSGFSKLYPNVRYELYEVPVLEMQAQLLNGLTEIGVARAPIQYAEAFNTIYEAYDFLTAVYPYKNTWIAPSDEPRLPLELLEGVPVNLSRGCLSAFKTVCADARITPNILSVNTTKTSTIKWARQGVGIAVVPVSGEENFGDFLCSKIIDDPRLRIKKTMVTARNHSLSPVAKVFLEYCRTLDVKWNRVGEPL